MASVLRFSEAANLALHTMGLMAGDPERVLSVREIAGALGGSEAHLSKVLQRLSHAGLVASDRGPKGGFRMVKSPGDVTLREVFEAIEGPLEPSSCLLARPVCDGSCILGGLLEKVNRSVSEVLSRTTLASIRGRLPVRWS
jgi:Rrf2 family protein